MTTSRLEQPQQSLADGCLATTGFAHQTHGLAAFNLKADTIHSFHISNHALHQPSLDRKILLEVLNLNNITTITIGVVDFLASFHIWPFPHRMRTSSMLPCELV